MRWSSEYMVRYCDAMRASGFARELFRGMCAVRNLTSRATRLDVSAQYLIQVPQRA